MCFISAANSRQGVCLADVAEPEVDPYHAVFLSIMR